MTTLLDVQVEESEGAAVVRCRGELDIFTRNALEAVLRRMLAEPARSLTLDLRGVTFIDSSGLCSILLALRARAGDPAGLRILPSRHVADLFRVAGIPRDRLDEPDARAGGSEIGPAYPASHWQAVLEGARQRLAEAEAEA